MDKKKRIMLPLVTVALGIGLIISFVKIVALEQEIDNIRSGYSSAVGDLRFEVGTIYQNVDKQLKEEFSLVSGVKATYGELNPRDHTFAVSLSVVPKSIREDTALQVSVNGRTAELTRSGSSYTGTIPVDLFTEEERLLLLITTAEGIQTEYLQDVYVAGRWAEFIPSLYDCSISGRSTFGDGKLTLDASLDINFTYPSDIPAVSFEKYVLITEINGQEIGREDITEEVLIHPNYLNGTYYKGDYKREYQVAGEDELTIRLEATDSLGYVHSRRCHYWTQYINTAGYALDRGEQIYDPAGNLLFEGY